MKNGERRARATLTMDELATAEDGWTVMGFRHGRWPGFGPGNGAVGTGEARRRRQRRSKNGRSKRRYTVGTPARGPDSAFNTLVQRGAWQPRGNGALLGRPGADCGV
jgi:hypothetical protein